VVVQFGEALQALPAIATTWLLMPGADTCGPPTIPAVLWSGR